MAQKIKKMSYYSGCHIIGMLFIIFFFFVGSLASIEDAEKETMLFDISSRGDMLKMAGYGEEKLSTVLVTGSVHCKACLRGGSELISWPVSGAIVVVKCQTQDKDLAQNPTQAFTDEFGDFTIDLPSHLHAIPNLEKSCTVMLLRLPNNSPCQPAYVSRNKAIRLSSVIDGVRTYSTGDIELVHSKAKPSQACNKKKESTNK